MNEAIASLRFLSFPALAPALLVKTFTTSRPAWWLILIMIFLLGWGMVDGTYVFYHLGINRLLTTS
jgi:hypothetical protein